MLEFTADSILWLLFHMLRRWFRLSNFNKVCSIRTILQLVLKDLVLVQPCLEDTRLPTMVPETEHLEDSKNSGVPKQHCIESCKLNLTRLGTKLALDLYIKFVLQKQNYNFYLRSNLITGTKFKLSLWSKSQLDKAQTRVLEQIKHFLGTSSTWTLHDLCCRVRLESLGQYCKVRLVTQGSVHLIRSFQQSCNLSFHLTFWIQTSLNFLSDQPR